MSQIYIPEIHTPEVTSEITETVTETHLEPTPTLTPEASLEEAIKRDGFRLEDTWITGLSPSERRHLLRESRIRPDADYHGDVSYKELMDARSGFHYLSRFIPRQYALGLYHDWHFTLSDRVYSRMRQKVAITFAAAPNRPEFRPHPLLEKQLRFDRRDGAKADMGAVLAGTVLPEPHNRFFDDIGWAVTELSDLRVTLLSHSRIGGNPAESPTVWRLDTFQTALTSDGRLQIGGREEFTDRSLHRSWCNFEERPEPDSRLVRTDAVFADDAFDCLFALEKATIFRSVARSHFIWPRVWCGWLTQNEARYFEPEDRILHFDGLYWTPASALLARTPLRPERRIVSLSRMALGRKLINDSYSPLRASVQTLDLAATNWTALRSVLTGRDGNTDWRMIPTASRRAA